MKGLLILVLGWLISIQSASGEDLYALMSTINAFPSTKEKKDAAIESLRKIPNAERKVWEYVMSQQTDNSEQIPNAFEALSTAGLTSNFTIGKSREILVSNSDFADNFDQLVAEAKAKPDDGFGFGPTSEALQSRQLLIEKLKGSVKIIGEYGRPDDIALVNHFLSWKDDNLILLASRASEKLKPLSENKPDLKSPNNGKKALPNINRHSPDRAKKAEGTWVFFSLLSAFVVAIVIAILLISRKTKSDQ